MGPLSSPTNVFVGEGEGDKDNDHLKCDNAYSAAIMILLRILDPGWYSGRNSNPQPPAP